MGSSGIILKNRLEYSPEKFLKDVKIAIDNAKLNLYINEQRLNEDRSFSSMSLNISDKLLDDSKAIQIVLNIYNVEENSNRYNEFDWIETSSKLHFVAEIEDTSGAEKLIFEFISEYFNINPNDYLWLDGYEWAYCLEDIKKLKNKVFDEEWCYKNPKLMV